MIATGDRPITDLTTLLTALAPFLRCEAGAKGGTCWPRCDGPERKALAEAVEALKANPH